MNNYGGWTDCVTKDQLTYPVLQDLLDIKVLQYSTLNYGLALPRHFVR